ncbi:hypothetical protein [Saccharothrix syringae]|uniref:Uncharacterized protein n=1 Tax=Saccharothrix syringae TaxID=103733 RepID=A0A5Q0H3R3_SACSY|nr:hypothetical protein [Saccharothrix syringae]QFZ20362.1 hypothetical protein EKG83_25715 [Saccharothrix syringae]
MDDLLSCEGDDLDEEVKAVAGLFKDMRELLYPASDPAGSTEPGRSLPSPSSPQTHSAAVGQRSMAYALALSENIAAEADRDRQTAAFRAAHLPDGLIRLDRVEEWIGQRAQEQPGDLRQARVRIPAGWQPDEPLPSTSASIFVDRLEYVAPGHDRVRWIVVAPGGVLGWLRRLSVGLATAHGWEPAQATTWVLTGLTPLVGLIRVTEERENIRDSQWMAWSERITLDVHPAAMPDEVADAYRAARKRFDARRTNGEYRARSQAIPQLALARFVARRRPRCTWDEIRVLWNDWITVQADYPGVALKRYDSAKRFHNEAVAACKRVLYRGGYVGRQGVAQAVVDGEFFDQQTR